MTKGEVVLFSRSHAWRNLLYINDDKTIMLGQKYFISNVTHEIAYQELLASIEAFKKHRRNKDGHLYQCLFPARFMLLNRRWPNEFTKKSCPEFEAFQKGIDVENIFLVYTSAYPNNPASMFGHTFIRFDRKSRGELRETKEILGYATAFQARTNPQDNPVMYTLKGIFGGYETYVEIKPQYINIGVYNNGESRDLWERKLDLNQDELEYLVAHLWELSHSGAFEYYFFDENCSTYLLRLLEAIKPSLKFKSKEELFVVPQVTYREITAKIGVGKARFSPSLKRSIRSQFKQLSQKEKDLFFQGKRSSEDLKQIHSVQTLDTLVDFWKLKNYQAKTKLPTKEKKIMFQTLLRRSQVKEETSTQEIKLPNSENPEEGHKLSQAGIGVANSGYSLSFKYGFHSFEDQELGFDGSSFINFMEGVYIKAREDYLFKLDIVDILSLQDFDVLFKNFSWRAKITYIEVNEESIPLIQGGVGLSKRWDKVQLYSLVGMDFIGNKENRIAFTSASGFKINLTKNFSFVTEGTVYLKERFPLIESKLSFDQGSYHFLLSHYVIQGNETYNLLISQYF